jgi:glycogen debranching enzyme GlgX
MIKHFKELGVTAIELLPVHAFVDDKHLLERGLRNYWGYNSLAFFSPETRYRRRDFPGSDVTEFKAMVKALHRAGIEVILDVVYNHTAEGNHLGPTLSYKGIDNPTYYRLVPDNPRFYFDYTGTGNSLNVRHPQTLQLIMDSLRYWVLEMHVDGFRFDLASTLARSPHEVDQLSSFFTIVHQDPVISQVKLIAEPWDVGEGGYQVGNFPVRLAEWNGKYRTRSAPSERARAAGWASLRIASPGAISTRTTVAARTRASTSSPHTTASRWRTSSPTTTSTTRRTARTTATGRTTMARGTAAPRDRRTIQGSARSGAGRLGTSSRA